MTNLIQKYIFHLAPTYAAVALHQFMPKDYFIYYTINKSCLDTIWYNFFPDLWLKLISISNDSAVADNANDGILFLLLLFQACSIFKLCKLLISNISNNFIARHLNERQARKYSKLHKAILIRLYYNRQFESMHILSLRNAFKWIGICSTLKCIY